MFTTMSETAGVEYQAEGVSVDVHVANRDLADKINQIARGLPLKQRMVFVLRDLQDLTVEEVAEILEMSHESVKTNLFHARRHIQRKLIRMEVQG